MSISVNRVSTQEEMEHCYAIRQKVFVEGQNVPVREELDGKDAESVHYLLYADKTPAGVARVRLIDNYAKIERVAVLDAYQGQGFGKVIMNYILADLQQQKNIKKAKLSSQTHAIPFYEKLGFVVCSDEYLDANIPHKDMILEFAAQS